MAQVVGRQCVICRKGIYDLLTGQPCAACGHPVHRECAQRFQTNGPGCGQCGGDPATAPGPERAARRSGSSELLPFLIGLVVVLGLVGAWASVMFLNQPRPPAPRSGDSGKAGASGATAGATPDKTVSGGDPIAILDTSEGPLRVRLYRTLVPETANNFVELASKGVYKDIKFHRIIAGFMAQTGDPTGTGAGGRHHAGLPETTIRDEFHPTLRHDRRGILSMANRGPNTGDCQFFILFGPAPHLDNRHAVFGEVIEGNETLDRLERTPVVGDGRGEASKPINPPIMRSVTIVEPSAAKPETAAATTDATGKPEVNAKADAGTKPAADAGAARPPATGAGKTDGASKSPPAGDSKAEEKKPAEAKASPDGKAAKAG